MQTGIIRFLYFSLWVVSKFWNNWKYHSCTRMFSCKYQNLNTPNLSLKIIYYHDGTSQSYQQNVQHIPPLHATKDTLTPALCGTFTSDERANWKCQGVTYLNLWLLLVLPGFTFCIPTQIIGRQHIRSRWQMDSSTFWMLCGFLAEHHSPKAILRIPCGRNIPTQCCTNDILFPVACRLSKQEEGEKA